MALIPLFIWLMGRNVIPLEEAMLSEAFGEEYRQYCQRMCQWI